MDFAPRNDLEVEHRRQRPHLTARGGGRVLARSLLALREAHDDMHGRRRSGIEVPERAQWIRTMMAEWNRILSHLMFTGSYPLELGAMTPIFYAFREREMIQDLMESATGARMHHSYCRVGGLKDDLPHGFLNRSTEVLKQVRKRLRDYENLIMGNEIIHARTKGIGVLPPETAIAYGCSGPVLQGSGVAPSGRFLPSFLKLTGNEVKARPVRSLSGLLLPGRR